MNSFVTRGRTVVIYPICVFSEERIDILARNKMDICKSDTPSHKTCRDSSLVASPSQKPALQTKPTSPPPCIRDLNTHCLAFLEKFPLHRGDIEAAEPKKKEPSDRDISLVRTQKFTLPHFFLVGDPSTDNRRSTRRARSPCLRDRPNKPTNR